MIDKVEALKIANDFLAGIGTATTDSAPVIHENATRERPFGWVFFYNSRRFLETGNSLFALSGNEPVVVLRNSGRVFYLPLPPHGTHGDLASKLRDFTARKDIRARIRLLERQLRSEHPE